MQAANAVQIRDARSDEYAALGRLLADAYTALPGFPGPQEQQQYYAMLADVGRFAALDGARLFAAVLDDGTLAGGVVYFSRMAAYGSGGAATQERNASGLRLLGVAPALRGRGIAKALTQACIAQARQDGNAQVILHTTRPMQVAWSMYEGMGFRRAPELDFAQGTLDVFGFRLAL